MYTDEICSAGARRRFSTEIEAKWRKSKKKERKTFPRTDYAGKGTRTHTQTRAHAHIYIYIYMFVGARGHIIDTGCDRRRRRWGGACRIEVRSDVSTGTADVIDVTCLRGCCCCPGGTRGVYTHNIIRLSRAHRRPPSPRPLASRWRAGPDRPAGPTCTARHQPPRIDPGFDPRGCRAGCTRTHGRRVPYL